MALTILAVAVVLAAAVAAAVLIFATFKKPQLTARDTDCYSISVPVTYTVSSPTITYKCTFTAHTGKQGSTGSQTSIIPTGKGGPDTIEKGRALLMYQVSDTPIETTTVGGYAAVVREDLIGESTLERNYVVISPQAYTIAPGVAGQSKGFFISIAVPAGDKSLADDIVNSIVWK
jgi:hypothetical protein